MKHYKTSHLTRPEILALAEAFDVPQGPINTTLTHGNRICLLDYPLRDFTGTKTQGVLEYGQRLRVTKPILPNRSGALKTGEIVTFLGHDSFPYDNGLRLYFEGERQRKMALEFEGNIPVPGHVQMWRPDMFGDHFEPLPATPRTDRLRALYDVVYALKGTVLRTLD